MEDKIRQVRARFESEISQNRSKYHRIDIERVRTEEWQVKRYLLDAKENVEQAYENLLKTCVWKAEFGVHELSEANCPKELYELYQMEIHDTDKAGRIIYSEAFKSQKPYKELDQVIRQMLVLQLEKCDRLCASNPETGGVYIGNITDTPLTYVDASLCKFKVDLLNEHYPLLARKIYLVNVPFLLKPFIKLIVSFMKPSIRDAVENVNFDQLASYIDRDVLPVELGGRRVKRFYPEGAGSMRRNEMLSSTFVEHYIYIFFMLTCSNKF